MKKILTTIAIAMILAVGADAKVQGNLTDSQVKAVQKLIQLYGYKCDYVNFAMRSSWSGMIDVSCNGNRYSYDIEDKGGRWTVTLD